MATKKTTPKKKATSKDLPPNPGRMRRATVRTVKVDYETACEYVSEYEFFCHKVDGKNYHLTADKAANEKFEAANK